MEDGPLKLWLTLNKKVLNPTLHTPTFLETEEVLLVLTMLTTLFSKTPELIKSPLPTTKLLSKPPSKFNL